MFIVENQGNRVCRENIGESNRTRFTREGEQYKPLVVSTVSI